MFDIEQICLFVNSKSFLVAAIFHTYTFSYMMLYSVLTYSLQRCVYRSNYEDLILVVSRFSIHKHDYLGMPVVL